MPDLPICLIKAPREFDLNELCRLYGVTTLERGPSRPSSARGELQLQLTRWCGTSGRPRLSTISCAIDAGTVQLGDITAGLPWRDFDLIYNDSHEDITPHIQRTQYFDPDKVFAHFDTFAWDGRPYFNSGVFVARRECLDLDEYLAVLKVMREVPGSFFLDQGALNFLAFRNMARDRLEARVAPTGHCAGPAGRRARAPIPLRGRRAPGPGRGPPDHPLGRPEAAGPAPQVRLPENP